MEPPSTTEKLQAFTECQLCAQRRQWTPRQYFCLEKPMDAGAWWATVHGVANSRTGLSDFTFALHFHELE